MSMMEDGFAFLAEQKIANCSKSVIYREAGQNDITLDAEVSRTAFEMDSPSGVIDSTETRDFLIQYADLGRDPKRGAQIIEVLDGVTYTRTVATPTGTKPWQHDGFRGFIRVHTWDRQEES